MHKRKGFTLIELLVVIAVIALLMAILMPALNKANRQAKMVVCQSNLRHWGTVFAMYTGDNDDYFQDRVWFDDSPEPWNNPLCFGGHSWPTTLLPYYDDIKLRFCPMATKTFSQGAQVKFSAWGQLDNVLIPADAEYIPKGSYGMNGWIVNTDLGETDERYWKTPSVKGAHNIPVLLDAWWPSGFPEPEDEPLEFENQLVWGEIIRYSPNRHNGFVNGLFCDWSVRRLGLKELWTLKWHHNFDINGPWTIAGFNGDVTACARVWDEAAPWMRNFPEY